MSAALGRARSALAPLRPLLRRPIERAASTAARFDVKELRRPLLMSLTALAALLLIAAEFATQREVWVYTAKMDSVTSGERHAYVLLALALAALVLGWGAAIGRSRPAAIALAVVASIALLVVLAVDMPGLKGAGTTSTFYTDVSVRVGSGIFLEAAGSVLLLLAACILLRLNAPTPQAQPAAAQAISGTRA